MKAIDNVQRFRYSIITFSGRQDVGWLGKTSTVQIGNATMTSHLSCGALVPKSSRTNTTPRSRPQGPESNHWRCCEDALAVEDSVTGQTFAAKTSLVGP